MKKIFTGFILIFLDFNLTAGDSVIGLIPDFVGYIFIATGMEELSWESKRFLKIRPYAIAMAVYCGVLYALDLFGLSSRLGMISLIPAVIGAFVSLYISYQIIEGIKDIEQSRCTDLNSARLSSTWLLLIISQVLAYILIFIPALMVVCIIAAFALTVIFLVQFSRTKSLYEALWRGGREGGI